VQVLGTVGDLDNLGPKLVTLIGQRLARYLNSVDVHESVLALSRMTPELSRWISEQVRSSGAM